MYIIRLLRYLRGYVKFISRSVSIERFINLCVHHGIVTWGTRRTEGSFSGYTSVRGYRRMHRLARKAGVCTRVTERHGVPFILHRYRKRMGIAVGVLLFAVFLIGTQQFVWVVRVEGCQKLEQRVLLNALEELGVKRGVLKNSIQPSEIREQLTLMVNELAWATLNIRGTTATLLIRERTPPPPKIDTNAPANIVAAQDGQIRRMEVTDGRAVLKTGDTVRAGEIIVSGINQDRWGLTHLVRANARVIAHVPQTLEVQVPLNQETVHLTGEVIKRRYLEVFDVRLPLFIYSGLEGDYKIERLSGTPEILGVRMPFEITRETYIFYERDQQMIREETALRIAQQQLMHKEKETWGNAILKATHKASEENGILTLTGEYVVETDIAKQVEIPVFDRKEQEKLKKPREGGY
ncbi:sporulation protein YqfD [Oscillospiraceae bacterium PP1C4]